MPDRLAEQFFRQRSRCPLRCEESPRAIYRAVDRKSVSLSNYVIFLSVARGGVDRAGALFERHVVRQQKSRPLIDTLEPWLRTKLGLISQKSKLAEAIRYTLSRWEGLTRFIDDGRIEIDNNTVERSIRPIALNRKNALFAGSDGGAETLGHHRLTDRDL